MQNAVPLLNRSCSSFRRGWKTTFDLSEFSSSSDGRYTVYAYVNIAPGRDNGKTYIGQTKQTCDQRSGMYGQNYESCPRFWEAIQKYGWHSFARYELAKNLSKEDADKFEIFYIKLHNTQNPKYGYNIAPGGQDNELPTRRCRPVVLFDQEGNRVEEFYSATKCAEYLGVCLSSLHRLLRTRRGTCKGFMCKYAEDVKDIDKLPASLVCKPGDRSLKFKQVDLYDLDGNYIQTFESLIATADALGVNRSTVSTALIERPHRNTCAGYQVKYHSESMCNPIGKAVLPGELVRGELHYAARTIIQYDPTTCEEVARYGSIIDAARALKCGHTTLLHALCGESPSCKGFVWRYEDDTRPVEPTIVRGNPPDNPNRGKRAVWKLDPVTGERLERFNTTAEAARSVGVCGAAITYACRGKTKISAGYGWEYDV